MLAGEYSVLRGAHALAVTLNQHMTVDVTVEPTHTTWEVHSNLWSAPVIIKDFHSQQDEMLCRAVQSEARRNNLSGGIVRVTSDIDVKHGLGSSSALRLGVCAAMRTLRNGLDSQRASQISAEAVNDAWSMQFEEQGMASGYDIATQYAGGLVEFSFQYEENRWRPHWFKHQLEALPQVVHLFVGGKGAPTTSTMHATSTWLDGGNRIERLIETSENLVDAFLNMIRWPSNQSLKKLCAAAGAQRLLFAANPMFPVEIAKALADISGLDQTWSWKTTGAGGEDAIMLIGVKDQLTPAIEALAKIGWQPLGVKFGTSGISIEEASPHETSPQPTTHRQFNLRKTAR